MLKRLLASVTALLVPVVLLATASSASAVEGTHRSADQPPALIATPQPDIHRVAAPPTWVQIPKAAVDWKWFKAGWEIRFSKTETAYIAVGASACDRYLDHLRHPAFKVLSMGCALLSWYAATLVIRGRCLNAFVPLVLTAGFSVGSRPC